MPINLSDGKWISQPSDVSKIDTTEELSTMYFISNKDISPEKLKAVTQSLSPSDIEITSECQACYQRERFCVFQAKVQKIAEKTTERCLSYFIIFLVLRTDKDITND